MDKYQELYDTLSDDLKAKVATCKTGEELVALAEQEGIELTDEQLDAISGGIIGFVMVIIVINSDGVIKKKGAQQWINTKKCSKDSQMI